MRKLWHFITYNNLVPIAISLVLVGGATTYAATNPETVIQKEDKVISIDNTYISSVDLKKFTPSVKINAVTEDDEMYYIDYTFSTIALADSVWKDITTNRTLTVKKTSLGNFRDLGLFVTEELNELIASEKKRLAETQVIEKRAVTKKVVTTKYKGIVGGFLDDTRTEIAAYEPVVKPPKPPKEVQTFARPGPDNKKLAIVPPVITPPPEQVIALEPLPTEVIPEVLGESDTQVTDTTTTTPPTNSTNTTTTPDGQTTSSVGGGGAQAPATTTPEVLNESPTIAILGDTTVRIEVGTVYVDLGAVVTDDHDTDLTVDVYVDGEPVQSVSLDTSVPRTYSIVYESTDSEGLISQEERIVEVYAPDVPIVPDTNTPDTATTTPDATATPSDTADPVDTPSSNPTPPADTPTTDGAPEAPATEPTPTVPPAVTGTTTTP